MGLRLQFLAALLVCVWAGGAAAQYEFLPEGSKNPPPKAKRTKPPASKAAPPAGVPNPAAAPAKTAPDLKPAKTAQPADDAPMQVYIVRGALPGCEPDCPEWIAAQGRIDGNSLGRFKKALKQAGNRKLVVLIDSSGGSVEGSLAIGRLIRSKGLDVAVTRTELQPCGGAADVCKKATAKGLRFGVPKALFAKCASACAFVLAGGVRRFVSPRTFVGVHQFTISETKILRTYRIEKQPFWTGAKPKQVLVSQRVLSTSTKEAGANHKSYVNVKKFFTEMGIGDGVMTLVVSTPSNSIHILTRAELEATKMATDWLDAEELITGVPMAIEMENLMKRRATGSAAGSAPGAAGASVPIDASEIMESGSMRVPAVPQSSSPSAP